MHGVQPRILAPPKDFQQDVRYDPAIFKPRQDKPLRFVDPAKQLEQQYPHLKLVDVAHQDPLAVNKKPAAESKKKRTTPKAVQHPVQVAKSTPVPKVSKPGASASRDVGTKVSKPKPTRLTLKEFLELRHIPDQKKETIDLVKKGGDLSAYLDRESQICSVIKNGELTFGKVLGKGVYGKASELLFKNQIQRYAVKETLPDPKNPLVPCSRKEVIVPRNDGRGNITFPAGSFLCGPITSEFVISLMVADLRAKGRSLNFIDTFYFATCHSAPALGIRDQYTFMEQVDGDLKKIFDKATDSDVASLYIQILHALATCQTYWNIVHSDLHESNVFVENIENSPYAKDLTTSDYFGYIVGDTKLTIPRCRWIAKIADWGMAAIYSPMVLGNSQTLRGRFGVIVPNFFSAAYDAVYITIRMFLFKPNNELLKRSMAWILRCSELEIGSKIAKCFDVVPDANGCKSFRPLAGALTHAGCFAHVSPRAMLTDPVLMQPYLSPVMPKNPKIFALGKI